MVNYVASLCWSCFFSAASSGHTLVHAFVSSRLDYTATVYCMESVTVWWRRASGVPEFGGTCSDRYQKFDHITPVLRDLHWLPIRQRKLAVIVFRCLRGLAPSYLADDCVLASAATGRRHLRSTDTMKLLARRTMDCHRRQGLCSFGRSYLEQSTSQQLWDCLPAWFRILRKNWQELSYRKQIARKLRTQYVQGI